MQTLSSSVLLRHCCKGHLCHLLVLWHEKLELDHLLQLDLPFIGNLKKVIINLTDIRNISALDLLQPTSLHSCGSL